MKIILASQSPRRSYFLSLMGLEFDVIPSNFVEYNKEELSVVKLVEELGLGKVLEVAKKYPDAIVIGGDSMVTIDGKQLGKPKNEIEAKLTLKSLSNRKHEVITSVAVVCISKNYQKVESETTTVVFDELTDEFIEKYVATGTVFDKAGSYAIQHPLMTPHVTNIDGNIDTIMGMATQLVAELLKELGIEMKPIELTLSDLLTDPELSEKTER